MKFLSLDCIKEFIVGQKQENRRRKQSTIEMFSSSLQSFCEKLTKPEKSETSLVCMRRNCSVVSRSVLFEETNLSTNTSWLPHSSSRWLNSLVFNRVHCTSKASKVSKPKHCLQEPESAPLIFSCWLSLARRSTNSLKRRRHFRESSRKIYVNFLLDF